MPTDSSRRYDVEQRRSGVMAVNVMTVYGPTSQAFRTETEAVVFTAWQPNRAVLNLPIHLDGDSIVPLAFL